MVDTEFREGAVGRTRSCANAGKKVKTFGSLQYVELMTARRVLFGHNEKNKLRLISMRLSAPRLSPHARLSGSPRHSCPSSHSSRHSSRVSSREELAEEAAGHGPPTRRSCKAPTCNDNACAVR